jgi:hypothetical protein
MPPSRTIATTAPCPKSSTHIMRWNLSPIWIGSQYSHPTRSPFLCLQTPNAPIALGQPSSRQLSTSPCHHQAFSFVVHQLSVQPAACLTCSALSHHQPDHCLLSPQCALHLFPTKTRHLPLGRPAQIASVDESSTVHTHRYFMRQIPPLLFLTKGGPSQCQATPHAHPQHHLPGPTPLSSQSSPQCLLCQSRSPSGNMTRMT